METMTIKTYADAINAGYRDGRTAWQRGYVSRKANIDNQPIISTHDGELYILRPSWRSTQYCVRQYLVAPVVLPGADSTNKTEDENHGKGNI